jgi:predicted amidophosphoribosyltransferase
VPAGFKLPGLAGELFVCRGCLHPVGAGSEAGLCARCWEGLIPLDPLRCLRCALAHGEGECPDPVAWDRGDALWAYHGGRPPLGALLLPGIKQGDLGWRAALLGRLDACLLPTWIEDLEAVVPVPTHPWRRWRRGFDLAEDLAGWVAHRMGVPVLRPLRKAWRAPAQAERSAGARRRLPKKAFRLVDPGSVAGKAVLLVDDVWTTGTSLLRCAQALQGGGATVRVLTLFRAT